MWLSDKVRTIRPSGVRKIFDLARSVKEPVDLSLGEPDFDIPDPIKEEAIVSIRGGFNKYTPSGGIPELREKLLGYLHGRGIICDDVIVTPGVTGGLLLALLVTLDPGDELVIPDPYFVLYEYQTILLGGKPVFFDTYPDFTLREGDLRGALSTKTKGILINSPNNPTGAVYSEDELAMVARVAREKNILVYADDIYDHFVYDAGADELCGDAVSNATRRRPYLGRLYENTLTFGGFSKNWGMTGWRLGFVAGPKQIIDSMVTMQQYVFSSVNSIAQKAALVALDYDTTPLIESFRRKRDLIYDGLKDRFRLSRPRGAYYAFPEAPGGDGDAFVERALAKKLFVIPGSVFSCKKSHIRISFAAGEEAILKGIDILNSLA